MLVDCDSCAVRGPACDDCVVSVLLGVPSPARPGAPGGTGTGRGVALELAAEDHRAIDALAGAGLVPRLRLVSTRGTTDGQEAPPRRAG